jgi:glycosyltransferase involved in cell wall biosynthesis
MRFMTRRKKAGTANPIRVMFLHTTTLIGGAETLMLNLIRRLDRGRFAPELCCLKALGTIGELLSGEIPTYERLLKNRYDLRVLPRLALLMRRRRVDAIISVGAGDKMFWGRLAAGLARVPVVICSIHSTGWPDQIGRLNRALTPLTDMFVGVAESHGRYLIEEEGFPPEKVCVIPNGIDADQFRPRPEDAELRSRLGIPPGPVAGTVARLGPEKNHKLFLDAAAQIRRDVPQAQFLIVGDGPLRGSLEQYARQLGIANCVHFLGLRHDVPEILALMNVFMLTSHMEANPVSVLEAFATGLPVVSTRVGSVPETVREDTGLLVDPGDCAGMAQSVVRLLSDPALAQTLGMNGRQAVIRRWSLDQMVRQYEDMIEEIYRRNRPNKVLPETVPLSEREKTGNEEEVSEGEECLV